MCIWNVDNKGGKKRDLVTPQKNLGWDNENSREREREKDYTWHVNNVQYLHFYFHGRISWWIINIDCLTGNGKEKLKIKKWQEDINYCGIDAGSTFATFYRISSCKRIYIHFTHHQSNLLTKKKKIKKYVKIIFYLF